MPFPGKITETVIECPTMETLPEAFDMEAYYEQVHTEATDASLGENNVIIPAVTGISFDVEAAQNRLDRAREGLVITIPLEITLPEVSTEEIEALPLSEPSWNLYHLRRRYRESDHQSEACSRSMRWGGTAAGTDFFLQ